MRRKRRFLALAPFVSLALGGCSGPVEPTASRLGAATHVGRGACAACHPEQVRAFAGSHHDLAMQIASDETVLGDFEDAAFRYAGVTTTFFRDNGDFRVRTDGPGGALADFRIAYTFGVEPLQQYLIEFPDGRVQALSIGWDARPAAEGGQRWFHLYPQEEVDHRDPLHWTGPLQNWNHMCAECHSTHLEKNYRPAEDRYETTFAEMDVSCEACHGPGSRHVLWAETSAGIDEDPSRGLAVRLADVDAAAWIFDESGTARRTRRREDRSEIEACGRCHARRSPLVLDYRHGSPLADSYRLALLEEDLYHADGQIADEVYVYGSFLQSRMYREGVTCSDCHDPHSATVLGREEASGNALCARCHLPAKFDTPEHHHHEPQSAGARCVECHMPARTYMVVDARRDHSLRVPRPDLSEKIGTPNACNGCHQDRDARWASAAVNGWYGPERAESFHYGEALHAGRGWQIGAGALLARVADDPDAPGIARASALELLVRFPDAGRPLLERASRDGDPLVRRAAARVLETAPHSRDRLDLLLSLSADSIRSVRLAAARTLASVPVDRIPTDRKAAVELAIGEFRDAQEVHADRAASHLNLADLHLRNHDLKAAEEAYRRALQVDPSHALTRINLADLYRLAGRRSAAEKTLREALEIEPENGDAHHALGLALVRQGRTAEAIKALARAARLRPDAPRYAYVYAVALSEADRSAQASEVLEEALLRYPAHSELRQTLTALRGSRSAP